MKKGLLILLASLLVMTSCTSEPEADPAVNAATEELSRLMAENEILKSENEYLKSQLEALEPGQPNSVDTDINEDSDEEMEEVPINYDLVSVYDEASSMYGIETVEGEVIYGPIFDSIEMNPDNSLYVTVGNYSGDMGSDAKINWRGNVVLPDQQLNIIDESENNPTFAEFIEAYKTAVAEKDVEFIEEHLAESISIYIDTYQTPTDFMNEWDLNNNPQTSDFWREMGVVLRLGIYDGGDYFMAPNFTPNMGTITGVSVNVRNAPSLDSKIIAQVSYEPVLDTWLSSSEWARVILHDGTLGCVHQDYFRGEYGYGAFFKEVDGQWSLTGFNVGD